MSFRFSEKKSTLLDSSFARFRLISVGPTVTDFYRNWISHAEVRHLPRIFYGRFFFDIRQEKPYSDDTVFARFGSNSVGILYKEFL